MSESEVKVEEVKDDDENEEESDDMPGLEQVPPAEGGEGATPTGRVKQSRSEKKSRKAVTRLGMKQQTGFVRVTVKKGKSVLFIITNPDVYKSPSNDTTWVIFGEAKIEDVNNAALQKTAEQFAAKGAEEAAKDDDIPDLESAPSAEPVVETPSTPDEAGVSSKYVDLVMEQTNCSTAQAIAALQRNNNDIVNAIMELSLPK